MRFYDVQRGRILLDGVDVRDWDLQSLRENFAVVLQDIFSLPAQSKATSGWAAKTSPMNVFVGRPMKYAPTISSSACLTITNRKSANAAPAYQSGKSN
jgi:hypothetical protein